MPPTHVRSRSLLLAGVALATGAALLPAGPAVADTPHPGSAGIGDRLYPTLGNGGYDARHYTLRLRYTSAANDAGIDGTVVMRARATQSLSRFDLDFSGDGVGSVSVDGRPATFTLGGGELVITPARAIRRGSLFRVRVRHFRSTPQVADPNQFAVQAFVVTPAGSVTAGQPNNMHQVFPVNDHPRDKASYTIRFDVPRGRTAVANGRLVARHTAGGRTYSTYRETAPMASELVSLSVGAFTVVHRRRVGRILVRDVVPTSLLSYYRLRLSVERPQLRWMQRRVGAYPFDSYGSLVADSQLGFALENQTLSLYDTNWWTHPRGVWDPVMLHELSHQWFGDSVAPYSWSDVWQNEGHATWYENHYAAAHGYLQDDAGYPTLLAMFHEYYQLGDLFRASFGPVGRPLSGDAGDVFSPQAYVGGALVLYALQQKVGVRTFHRIERAWVTRNRGTSRSTADFVRLASSISHRPLGGFLRRWLYGTTTPPMPGHPDWTVLPPDSSRQRALRHQVATGTLRGLPASYRLGVR